MWRGALRQGVLHFYIFNFNYKSLINVPFLLVLCCRWSVSVQEAVLLCISDQTLPFQFFLNKATHLEVDGSEWSIQPTYWNCKWCYQNVFRLLVWSFNYWESTPENTVSQRKNIHRYLFVGRPHCLPQGFRNCSKASLYTTWLVEIGLCHAISFQVMLVDVTQSQVVSFHVMSCHVMRYHVTSFSKIVCDE